MTIKHYDVVRASSPSSLAEKLTQKIKEGWQPFGSPVAITPYTLMQAVSADGDVTTPVVVNPVDGVATVISTTSEPEWYYVVVIAGQSNAMSYGEGIPLPESYDRPDPRIKQLARRSTVTPGGEKCAFNDIIPADHCLHDVQDMSKLNHPKADLSKGQYGCVGQGLHIAKKLLPYIPANAGILLVPCARGGSAFTTGDNGTYSDATGASESSARWGVGKPLYQDLIFRTKAALQKNQKNVLLAVCWMQGEFDLTQASYAQQPAAFIAMVNQFRSDLSGLASQCHDGDPASVPWICGDTTYTWKQKYATQYEAVYGAYKNKESQHIYFVPFMTDGNGVNTPTNNPAEDPDISEAGYYGAASRANGNWVSSDRPTHFSSWARRGIIADRMASAVLQYAGRTKTFISGEAPEIKQPSQPVTEPSSADDFSGGTVISLLASSSELSGQGWTLKEVSKTAQSTKDVTQSVVDAEGATGGKALKLSKSANTSWQLEHASGNGEELLKYGGAVTCRFKIPDSLVKDRFAMAMYWRVFELPDGVSMSGSGWNKLLLSFFLQTDSTNLNLMYHKSQNEKLGTFGAFNNDWHTLTFRFPGNNSTEITPVLDGQDGTPVNLVKSNVEAPYDTLRLTDITYGEAYTVLLDSVTVEVNPASS